MRTRFFLGLALTVAAFGFAQAMDDNSNMMGGSGIAQEEFASSTPDLSMEESAIAAADEQTDQQVMDDIWGVNDLAAEEASEQQGKLSVDDEVVSPVSESAQTMEDLGA